MSVMSLQKTSVQPFLPALPAIAVAVTEAITASSIECTLPILSRLPLTSRQSAQTPDTPNKAGPYLTSQTADGRSILNTTSRLPNIDQASHDLWESLHHFRPIRADYVAKFEPPSIKPAFVTRCPFAGAAARASKTAEIVRSTFNWDELRLPAHTSGVFYGVVFRSLRRPGSESTDLYDADRLAHEEAVHSGGLLMYWYGVPDSVTGANLATCIWTSQDYARRASKLPLHREAVRHAVDAYESFDLSRYAVVKRKGEDGVRIEPWRSDEAVGGVVGHG